MDKRWKMSKFAGLPKEFISFAKRLDLKYKSKSQILVDRDGEPVAWLLGEEDSKAEKLAGFPAAVVAVWHPEGPAKMSFLQLAGFSNRADLLEFQGKALTNQIEKFPNSLSISQIMEDTKHRAVRRAAMIKSESEELTSLPDVLRELGTVGREDILTDIGHGAAFLKEFERVPSSKERGDSLEDPRSYKTPEKFKQVDSKVRFSPKKSKSAGL